MLLFLFFYLATGLLFASEIGYLDSRACMLSHPAFQKFDWETRRFFDTISAPVKDFAEESARLNKLEETATAELKGIEKQIGKAFSDKDGQNASLWKSRSQLVNEIEYIKQRRLVLKTLQENESMLPDQAMVWCTLEGIEKDLANVFSQIRQQHKVDILMDAAALTPIQHPSEPQMHVLCDKRLESFLEDPKSIESDDFAAWLANSRHYWQRKLPGVCNNPFKYGAKDYTDAACALIKSTSEIKTADRGEEKIEK
ncbi:MAG: hypothetical protein A2W80_16775 [Candidatus Riflebacteria bacterium GWC2_50_8]|nr:MAG: hypothetical protein A2W80_16775 [Candidatus Riflebacteria bacterium GWC2_50_8]